MAIKCVSTLFTSRNFPQDLRGDFSLGKIRVEDAELGLDLVDGLYRPQCLLAGRLAQLLSCLDIPATVKHSGSQISSERATTDSIIGVLRRICCLFI